MKLHLCPLQSITIMTQTFMGLLVISSLSRFTPSSWDMSLCRSFMGDSFDIAFERICRRCFFLQDLRLRSIPPTNLIPFLMINCRYRNMRNVFPMDGFGHPSFGSSNEYYKHRHKFKTSVKLGYTSEMITRVFKWEPKTNKQKRWLKQPDRPSIYRGLSLLPKLP
jgi:hypothetical protein